MEPTKQPQSKARVAMAAAMVIFGTIGIFRRSIPLSSGVIALARGVIGTVFLCGLLAVRRQKFSWRAVAGSLPMLAVSGALLGFNWMLLFEAYRYTSVARATLCYYMAPIFVMLAAPFLLGEKLTGRKIVCVLAALAGMVLVTGNAGGTPGSSGNLGGLGEVTGLLLGLSAAVLYAGIVLLNKKLPALPPYEKTTVQLGISAVVLLPYLLANGDLAALAQTPFTPMAAVLLVVVGVAHTGVAYALYFGAMGGMPAQSVALFGYIDPVVAILLSALLLHEPMGPAEIAGAALVLGATLASELPAREKRT